MENAARNLLAHSLDGHDWDHTRRVRLNALALARKEGADLLIVEVAALLHDIGRPQESRDHGETDHAALGAQMARDILTQLGVTDDRFVAQVTHCIAAHRYRCRNGGLEPSTPEARCLFDADKLDSMGAIGIGRAFHFAGCAGARVHNTAEEALASSSYSHEDTAYREYLVKLRHLKDAMLTSTGRAMARERSDFMDAFFQELLAETSEGLVSQ
ncbi:MAG: HD domain-containing protein [Victivallales bacterium]|nr:HD domain-containing protein [Victivallales bacterium]